MQRIPAFQSETPSRTRWERVKKEHPIVKESIGTIFPSKRSNYQDKNMKMYLNIEISMGIVFRFFVRHDIHAERAI